MQRILHHLQCKNTFLLRVYMYICIYYVFAGFYQHFCFLSLSRSCERACIYSFVRIRAYQLSRQMNSLLFSGGNILSQVFFSFFIPAQKEGEKKKKKKKTLYLICFSYVHIKLITNSTL